MLRNIKILSSINPKHHIHFTSLPAAVLTEDCVMPRKTSLLQCSTALAQDIWGFSGLLIFQWQAQSLSKWIITSSQSVLNLRYYFTEQSKNLQSCSISPFYPLIHNVQYNNSQRSASRSVWMVTPISRNTEVKFAWEWTTAFCFLLLKDEFWWSQYPGQT